MKFGQVEHPEEIDFTLPPTPAETLNLLQHFKNDKPFDVYVGCAKWNKQDLKGFIPEVQKTNLLITPHSLTALNSMLHSTIHLA